MTIEVAVQKRGLDIEIIADKTEHKMLPDLVESAAEYAYAGMLARLPIRTGALLGSMRKKVQGLQATIGPTAPHAIYIEYGTAPHTIRPVFAKVLAFEITGKMVFTPIVRHPGTRPQPVVRETAEEVKRKIPELWREIIEKELS